MIIGAESGNSKYDFKTIKVRPQTYKRLVRLKALIESENEELHSFDKIMNNLLDRLDKEDKVETFSAKDNKT